VEDALTRAHELLAFWDDELRKELPDGADIFDAHVHLGRDIDGMSGDFDELLRIMDAYGVSRGFMFCLDEPDRHPGFRAPNGRTLEAARRSGGRLIPFARLDLGESPVEEATRSLDLGARGIKLHPRAQRFLLDDARLEPIFALAAERGVPILIHGGRGLPPIADELHALVERHPESKLIIAHAGIADLAGLARRFAGRAGVFFDTSAWSPIDLLDFFRQISPEQVLYASDYPYGQQPASLLIALRTARTAGLDEQQIRDLLAGNAARITADEPLPAPTPPKGAEMFSQPMVLARIHQYIAMASPLLWMREPDSFGVLGLALNATEERDGRPDQLERIRELLLAARDLWRTLPEIDDETDRVATSRLTFRLLHLADIVAVTPDAGA
jgi:predicted TIM-barrel fold metal-dependent hydrolase